MRYRQIVEKFDWLLYLLDCFDWSLYYYGTSYLHIIDKNEKKVRLPELFSPPDQCQYSSSELSVF
jgi:hypothetical protein